MADLPGNFEKALSALVDTSAMEVYIPIPYLTYFSRAT